MPDDITTAFHTIGYLLGIIDGLILAQESIYNSMFPQKYMSETEREELSKKMNFRRINIPERGVAVEQLMLIYKKYAEK